MVVTRKVWGGNRTTRGARTQSVLVSILQTCRQQLRPVSSFLQKLMCSPQPEVLDLTGISFNHGLSEVATNCPTAG
jgi:transposase